MQIQIALCVLGLSHESDAAQGGSVWGLAAAPQNSFKLLSQWQPGYPTTTPATPNTPSAQRLVRGNQESIQLSGAYGTRQTS
jgi:hypothetical protein